MALAARTPRQSLADSEHVAVSIRSRVAREAPERRIAVEGEAVERSPDLPPRVLIRVKTQIHHCLAVAPTANGQRLTATIERRQDAASELRVTGHGLPPDCCSAWDVPTAVLRTRNKKAGSPATVTHASD